MHQIPFTTQADDPGTASGAAASAIASSALDWCFDWAKRHVKLLPQENWMTFCQNMSAGIELVTRFSGLDAPGAAARVIEEACKHHGVKLPDTGGFTCHSAAERDRRPLSCLRKLGDSEAWRKHAPQHLFLDLESFVTESALKEMKTILAKRSSASTVAGTSADREGLQVLMEVMGVLLLKRGLKKEVACDFHERDCLLKVWRLKKGRNCKLSAQVTGSPCIDWSRRGKRQRGDGDTMLPFAIWISEFIASEVPILVHECTPDFPDEYLLAPMHHYAARSWKIEVFRFCPTDLGIPCRRSRRYSVLWDASRVTFTGTFREFVSLFFRAPNHGGQVWFHAGADIGLEASRTNLEAKVMYQDLYAANILKNPALSKQSICDLNQKPPFGKLDEFLPTLVTQHRPYCISTCKLLAADESLQSQLIPHDHPSRVMLTDEEIKDCHARFLSGNTMNVCSIGTMMLYVIANVRHCSADAAVMFNRAQSSLSM